MKTAEAGRNLIKAAEGFSLHAYPDPATHGEPWTIGYGHTSRVGPPAVHPGMVITAVEAEQILIADLAVFEAAVSKALTRVPTQNQFDAMVSLCFNIGAGNFAHSTVVNQFNFGNIQAAASAFRLWNMAAGKVMPGLIRRREAEHDLFLKPDAAPQNAPQPVPVTVTLPPDTPQAAAPAAPRGLWDWLLSLFESGC